MCALVCAGAKSNRFAFIAKYLLLFYFSINYSNLCTKIIKLDSDGGLLRGSSPKEDRDALCCYNISGSGTFSFKFELSLFVYLSSLFVVVFVKTGCHENIYGRTRTGIFLADTSWNVILYKLQSSTVIYMQTLKTDGIITIFSLMIKLMGYGRMVLPVEQILPGWYLTGKQEGRLITLCRILSFRG